MHDLVTTMGQGVCNGIEAPGLILHTEIKAEKLAYPLMLRYYGQPLVEQELERKVIRAHGEVSPPKIWSPMSHGLDQSN
jgi:hypothetical protein